MEVSTTTFRMNKGYLTALVRVKGANLELVHPTMWPVFRELTDSGKLELNNGGSLLQNKKK